MISINVGNNSMDVQNIEPTFILSDIMSQKNGCPGNARWQQRRLDN